MTCVMRASDCSTSVGIARADEAAGICAVPEMEEVMVSFFVDDHTPGVGAYPQIALAVLVQGLHGIIPQAVVVYVIFSVGMESVQAGAQHAKAAIVSTYPQIAIVVSTD